MIHTNGAHFPTLLVTDIVTGNFLASVVFSLAAPLCCGVSIVLLDMLLRLIACVASTSSTRHRCQFLAITFADLFAQHATHYRPDSRPGKIGRASCRERV